MERRGTGLVPSLLLVLLPLMAPSAQAAELSAAESPVRVTTVDGSAVLSGAYAASRVRMPDVTPIPVPVSPPAQAPLSSPLPVHGRKRVAIVLSGGGARGLAHVGVFKALEKLRVPYDCIVGTSMGAIAGGGFATGISVEEAERRVEKANWDAVFADRPRRSDIPYFRKSEDDRPYFNFVLTLNHFHPVSPRHFVSVQNIGLFFRELTNARSAASFDDLPIPFRAVGTDIVTGDTVVMDKGTVADAMVASMTVPGLFAPYPYEGHLLVDGGLATNLPVELGQKLCGDVVIAVDVSSPSLQAEQLDSVVAIGEQVINISMMQRMDEERARLRPFDVLMVPDLDDVAGSDFKRVKEIIDRGEQVVLDHAAHLRDLQVSPAEYAAWKAAVAARKPATPVIDEVRVAEMRWVNPDVMSDLLKLQPGQPFDMATLHRNIERVYARGDFDRISYDLVDTGPGTADLDIEPDERAGRDYLRFGLGLYTDFKGDGRFSAQASLRRAWLNRLDGQWRTELAVGRDFSLQSEWYQPASLGSELFIAPRVFYTDQHREQRFSSPTSFGYQYTRTGAALEVGSVFGRFGEVRAGVTSAYATTSTESGPIAPDQSFHQGGFTVRSVYDQLDSVYFPHEGSSARINYLASREGLGADLPYDRLELNTKRAFTWGANTAQVNLRAATALGTSLPYYDAFGLGGLFNLSAYPRDFYLGNQLVSGALLLYRQVAALPAAFGRGIYAGTTFEAGRIDRALPGYATPAEALSAGAFVAADTVLGPFYLLGAVGDRQQRALYLALGVSF
ncbi:MAG TPA: patatin-like phospholipase family protein [Moraxellaceae bacterium]|nr:patatin-like phospholipase family protein [Moraxellaceae bacterium]